MKVGSRVVNRIVLTLQLLAALVLIQCENLTITTSLRNEHYINIIMPPGYTPMVWNLTNLMIEGNLDYTPF
jgi:hypothetical protein